MSINSTPAPLPTTIPPYVLADLKAVLEAVTTGTRPDVELLRRVRERSAIATEEIRRRHGVLDTAVDLVRQWRDEE
jgi:hypothetical protein